MNDRIQEIRERHEYIATVYPEKTASSLLHQDRAYLLSEVERLQTAATNAVEVLEQVKQREMNVYRYKTDVYLEADNAISHLKG